MFKDTTFVNNKHIDFKRSGGILLHPTSLPSEYGIGELGSSLYEFLDFLADNNLNLWQILPIGPTGYGNSPYQCLSAFAGNPLLISIEKLLNINLVTKDDVNYKIPFSNNFVDFGRVISYKNLILKRAYENYILDNGDILDDFVLFKKNNHYWLDTFALFMSLKIYHNQESWLNWPKKLRLKEKFAIHKWLENHSSEIEFYKFIQFLFHIQWVDIKNYADSKNISIIGDIPIFMALDSADVWWNPEMYYLDDTGNPIYIAGVPPDYFSNTGQRWGNPIYRWDRMKENGFKWWIQRVSHTLKYVDIIRLDHFRGFEAYWRIPANEPTAVNGEWRKGPGVDFFAKLNAELGELPIIAEDLGVITGEVEKIRDQFGFPGMKILQYAFDQNRHAGNEYLPHNYNKNCVVYTGTHDNNTTLGWYNSATQKTKDNVSSYIACENMDIVSKLIRLAWSSVANFAIIPLQDLLKLDESGRMNYPGKPSDNWKWRYTWDQLKPQVGREISKLSKLYGRF